MDIFAHFHPQGGCETENSPEEHLDSVVGLSLVVLPDNDNLFPSSWKRHTVCSQHSCWLWRSWPTSATLRVCVAATTQPLAIILCYTKSPPAASSLSVLGGEGEWEDVEEEEVIGGEIESEEAPMELEPQQNVRLLYREH